MRLSLALAAALLCAPVTVDSVLAQTAPAAAPSAPAGAANPQAPNAAPRPDVVGRPCRR
ncbi:MAG: hypothetical protein WDN49_20485 [Acetobacteraceae bacterium]